MPLVAIVGRPNVGKSTLFNRLTEARHSIVDDMSGVTRDRVYGQVLWNGRAFSLVDTGGFVQNSTDRIERAIREQVEIAIEEADVLLFIVDVTTGMTDLDEEMAAVLRRGSKPVITVANKADNEELRWGTSTFYAAGLGDVFGISSINGIGTGDMLDAVVSALPPHDEQDDDERLRIAIIGRPNVGKSSLANTLLGSNRSIVTEMSGTTRDSVDSPLKYQGRDLALIDTAGLRKRAKITENVEFYAFLRTERAIETCDVAVLLIDATDELKAQDIRVLKQAERMKKGLVIGINKWDLIEKDTHSARDYEKRIRERLKTLEYVPVITLSAETKQRAWKLLDIVIEVDENRRKRIATSKLNNTLLPEIERHHPTMYRGHRIKIKYVTQVREQPPVFNFFCNHPEGVKEPYRRFLENRLREHYGFDGVPLTLVFKPK